MNPQRGVHNFGTALNGAASGRDQSEALPSELRDVAAMLDTLGAADRSLPAAGFEDRIESATGHLLSGAAVLDRRGGVLARIGSSGALRIAAAVALVATVSAAWLAAHRGQSPTAPDAAGVDRGAALAANLVQDLEGAGTIPSAFDLSDTAEFDIVAFESAKLSKQISGEPSIDLSSEGSAM